MNLTTTDEEIESFVTQVNFGKMDGLIPAIVQDVNSKEVLMVGFMNKEALQLTLKKGIMHFWSRTRQKIWQKGEESGNISIVENITLDCDNDSVLCVVTQIGPICHTNRPTCFFNQLKKRCVDNPAITVAILEKIFKVIKTRRDYPSENSYVANLIQKGNEAILRKIGEEAVELLLAGKNTSSKEMIHEITDVIFHIMIFLASRGLTLENIYEELARRHQKKTKVKLYSN
ncbi:MAG: bifunctional phosphoribosyl-AMP cyclohydrolase/phosphoribosyl-ATP diphosphatase HisIE [Candidatus Heimdallarchaeota archaeon]|nr:bifunctional phosphoribosyl-AMP cyclohydrolase/phosphoribosyl-ATP diphosphatase HisIE [Candidatus Heimdallarchaeota archaeon]